ncbi:MAG: cysteine lyase [Phormidesmis priestleyi]|uniref:Cysteine lyase n=1 Tax=Phormidesmis priestleyi TaxID=268141 RepID=A0A2W4ZSX3_9CYAN|nr:MAG: cysteine lyase [Phormidesmis priestleyi]
MNAQQGFSSLLGKRYFNYGGQGPMADSAIAAFTQAQQKIQTEGPFANAIYQWLLTEGESVRAAIAQALGASSQTITLTENVTIGCNIPLWGLPWQKGDRILLGDCEHPGVVAAVAEISRRYGLEVSTCALADTRNGGDPIAVIEQALSPNTRLVIISHILWNTGQVLPLREIVACCHANAPHTRVLVDAAQSVGVLPLDQPGWTLPETKADYYAFTGHKWWCGPAGIGGLYVRPEVLAEMAPTFIGWRSVEVNDEAQPTGWKPDGRRFEVATSDYALWSALRQAMTVQATWGNSAARYARICTLSQRLWTGLQALPQVACLMTQSPPPSGLVSFQLLGGDGQPSPDWHSALVESLEAQKIYVRILLSPNCVRACVHYLTLESEVDDLIVQIKYWLRSRPDSSDS